MTTRPRAGAGHSADGAEEVFHGRPRCSPEGQTCGSNVSWDAELAQAYSIAAKDPDFEFIRWLWEGCPAGVAQEVAFGGIFPEIDASKVGAEDLEAAMSDQAPWGNYSSGEENSGRPTMRSTGAR
jgi:hypothetical protein